MKEIALLKGSYEVTQTGMSKYGKNNVYNSKKLYLLTLQFSDKKC